MEQVTILFHLADPRRYSSAMRELDALPGVSTIWRNRYQEDSREDHQKNNIASRFAAEQLASSIFSFGRRLFALDDESLFAWGLG